MEAASQLTHGLATTITTFLFVWMLAGLGLGDVVAVPAEIE